MSLGDWIITMIVLMIPIVGFVMLFVWGFSSSTNPNKSNFCKAALIFYLVGVVLSVLFWGSLIAMMGGSHSAGM